MIEKIRAQAVLSENIFSESIDGKNLIDNLWLDSDEGLFLFKDCKESSNLSQREIDILELDKRVQEFKDIRDRFPSEKVVREAFIIRELLRITAAQITLRDVLDIRDLDTISLYLQNNFDLIKNDIGDLKRKIKKNLDLFLQREKISKYKRDIPVRLLSIISLLGVWNFYQSASKSDSSYTHSHLSQQIDKNKKPSLGLVIPSNVDHIPNTTNTSIPHKIGTAVNQSVQPSSPGSIENMINQEALSKYGYSSWELYYLDYIISIESKFNPNAINSKSGACGLMQQDPCKHPIDMQSQTVYWNLNNQIQSFFEYIQVRYGGNIVKAYNHERTFNWY